jgi:hypothetical protein
MVRIDGHVHAHSDDPDAFPYCDSMGLPPIDPDHHTASSWDGPDPGESTVVSTHCCHHKYCHHKQRPR